MNEFDNLRRAWADLKTEMKETQPFKAVYTALIWVLDYFRTEEITHENNTI